MAYGNYFPVTYQPNYYGQPNPYYQQMQNQAMMQQNQQMQNAQQQSQQMQQPAIQQSGFVLVQSEQEARSYPVAPGNSITFKDESQPYCYVKTMGFNQLDRPTFEKYRLVKEDAPAESSASSGPALEVLPEYAKKEDVEQLRKDVEMLKNQIKAQTEKKTIKPRKVMIQEDDEDDE